MQQVRVRYGDRLLVCRVVPMPEQGNRIALHVQHDGHILVDVPPDMTRQAVKRAISKRARWLCRQVDAAHARYNGLSPRHYVSGETHFYLGRRYLLKRLPSPDGSTSVKLKGGQLQVHGADLNTKTVKTLLDGWYREQAMRVFQRRLNTLLPEIHWVNQGPPVRLRPMRKRWGSCSPSGPITLNPVLVKAPPACIDGVLIHELCHLKIGNHSPAFYRLLTQTLPDWKARKQRLDAMVERLMQV